MAPPSWTISNTSGRNTSESSSTTISSCMSLRRASSVLMLPHGVGSPRSSRLHLRTYWAIRPSSSARRRPVAPHPTLLDLLFFLHLVHTSWARTPTLRATPPSSRPPRCTSVRRRTGSRTLLQAAFCVHDDGLDCRHIQPPAFLIACRTLGSLCGADISRNQQRRRLPRHTE
jgi:hypothetical protein